MVKAEYEKKTNSIILRHVIEVVDVGTPINPLTVIGQIEGGVAQGVGYALTEALEHSRHAGKVISSDLLTYRVPLICDMPEIHGEYIENFEPTGPLGAKSVGELTTVPVAPAIADAYPRHPAERSIKYHCLNFFFIKPNKK